MAKENIQNSWKKIQLCKRLYSYLVFHYPLLILVLFCMALNSVLSIGRTALSKFLLDDVLLNSPKSFFRNYGYSQLEILLGLCTAAAIIAIFLGITKFGQDYLHQYLIARVTVDIQNEVFHHLLYFPMEFFNRQKVGDLLSRFTNDMNMVQISLRYLYGDFFLQPITLITAMAACLYYSWQLSILTFIIFPAVIVPLVQMGKKIHRRARSRQMGISEVTQEMQQVFGGIRVIKTFHAEEYQSKEFQAKNEHFFRRAMKVQKSQAMAKSIIELLNNLGLPLIMGVGGYFIIRGGLDLTPGDLIAFIGATALMFKPVKSLSKAYNGLQEFLAGVKRVFELKELPKDPSYSEGNRKFPGLKKKMEFSHVFFEYEEGKPVLQDISFEAKAGEIIAFVGPSGVGKSTLLDLILRIYHPKQGEIRIDGVPIQDFELGSYREKIAVVGQDPYLFHRSIRDNIAFGRKDVKEEDIIKAAKAANIHDFIASLPQGYDTVVGERGVMLSGGQRQRITIARAVLREFSILLLDEATSSLDTESEKTVQEALERLMKGHTTFVVAHRLSTIKNASKIIVLSEGKVLAQGTHERLMEECEFYRNLYEMQFSSSPSPSTSITDPNK
ncbi:MAG: ABC transporter ATP-binding protein [Planctomycetota bacterium]|nr:MAG: ABC transporter ATP-binding protein [Planctomycetota bacterium]